MMKRTIGAFVMISFALTISGCVTQSKNVPATYVSPLQYQHYNCTQIGGEIKRVRGKVHEVGASQDSAAGKDAAALTVGLLVAWPALFFMIGGDRKDELARLKGEHDAIESAAIEKECTSVIADINAAKKQQEDADKAKAKEEEEMVIMAGQEV